MTDRTQYTPGPVSKADVQKRGEKWTLILVKELRHAPALVWQALVDPVQLREWAPYEVEGNLERAGSALKLTWVGTGVVTEAKVLRVDPPRVLEYADTKWELEPMSGGTRLTLWATIDRRFVSWGAAGWHICFDVLDHLLSGAPVGRLAGTDVMQLGAWQRLRGEYTKQFGTE
ncbi:MAG TPA: SRPBCC domain-containing protein [Gemmatimonadales bacterium]|nr:SRPBCC domain-containing protein [Gemmatimonadales bacterium]